MSIGISAQQKAALGRLIRIAQADTGQSRMTAEFLLSWWNAANCGGFDLTTMWGVDTQIGSRHGDGLRPSGRLSALPGRSRLREEFRSIVHAWRPA